MKKNLGSTDRIVRVIIAVVFAALYFSGSVVGTAGIVLVGLSAILLLTSVVSFCPLYLPFGLSSLRKKVSAKH